MMDGGSGGAWWGARLEGVHACRGDERLWEESLGAVAWGDWLMGGARLGDAWLHLGVAWLLRGAQLQHMDRERSARLHGSSSGNGGVSPRSATSPGIRQVVMDGERRSKGREEGKKSIQRAEKNLHRAHRDVAGPGDERALVHLHPPQQENVYSKAGGAEFCHPAQLLPLRALCCCCTPSPSVLSLGGKIQPGRSTAPSQHSAAYLSLTSKIKAKSPHSAPLRSAAGTWLCASLDSPQCQPGASCRSVHRPGCTSLYHQAAARSVQGPSSMQGRGGEGVGCCLYMGHLSCHGAAYGLGAWQCSWDSCVLMIQLSPGFGPWDHIPFPSPPHLLLPSQPPAPAGAIELK